MPVVDDLLPWLRAQIAAALELAERHDEYFKLDSDSWHTRSCGYGQGELLMDCDCEVPAAVLAQCEAHTAILDRWEHVHSEPGISGPDLLNLADEMLAALALAYQHCPGYREEWRP